MADPTKQESLHQQPFGETFFRPALVRVRGLFSASGATFTPSSTRRQSFPGVTLTGDTGSYAIAGLPRGQDYHVMGCELAPPTGGQTSCDANILAGSLNAGAGTATLKIRNSTSGAEADPADGTELFLTILVETGAY